MKILDYLDNLSLLKNNQNMDAEKKKMYVDYPEWRKEDIKEYREDFEEETDWSRIDDK